MLQRDDLGALSFAVWAETVDTLLPHTEFIVVKPAGDPPDLLLVAWADAQGVVGDLMEPTDHMPTRSRVRRFPDADQLARLKELAISL